MSLFEISYLLIQPTSKGDLSSDWQNCANQLIPYLENDHIGIFKLNIFVHSSGIESFRAKREFITKALLKVFGEKCPAFGILAQSPEKPFNLTIEAGIVNSTDLRISYRKYKDHRYTILENDICKELWANGLEDKNPDLDITSHSRRAFEIVHQILSAENMTFDHIVRQWNYIGNILRTDQNEHSFIQHYQIFNDVRNDYYSRYRSISDFPAATGIGMDFNSVAIDFCAITPTKDLLISSVNNPKQINPYTYDQKMLIGTPQNGQEQKTAPQFERAKLLLYHKKSQLFISGTASIIGQETMGKNDVGEQTRITIENINSLIERENLIHHCPQLNGEMPDNYSYIRVYVKNNADIPIVKSICSAHFGNTSVNYIQADICREDLLVEIEAELASK